MVQACMAAVACCAVMLMQPTHTHSTTSLLQYAGGPGQWARSHAWVVNASLFFLQNEWKDNKQYAESLEPFLFMHFSLLLQALSVDPALLPNAAPVEGKFCCARVFIPHFPCVFASLFGRLVYSGVCAEALGSLEDGLCGQVYRRVTFAYTHT